MSKPQGELREKIWRFCRTEEAADNLVKLINSEVRASLDRVWNRLDDAPSIEVDKGIFIHWNEMDSAIESERQRYE